MDELRDACDKMRADMLLIRTPEGYAQWLHREGLPVPPRPNWWKRLRTIILEGRQEDHRLMRLHWALDELKRTQP